MEKEPEKKEYSSKEVAALCGCGDRAARKWAAKNGVRFTGEGYRKDYHFTEADIERFRQRPRPGRRWDKGGGDSGES
jgi:hypothetical protein